MRELDCDFCGAQAVGAYEVVPAELDPTPDEQVRVVLCGDCRDTLDSVTAPLFARLGVADAASEKLATDPAQSTLESGTAGTADGSDPERREPEDGAQASARSENPVSPADDAVIIDPEKRRPPQASDDGNGVGTETGSADSEAGDGESDGTEESTVREVAGEPDDFRSVMRLLNNREFPIDRTEITDLASGAYELEVSEVDDIIDHAVERGVLAEDGGKLRKA